MLCAQTLSQFHRASMCDDITYHKGHTNLSLAGEVLPAVHFFDWTCCLRGVHTAGNVSAETQAANRGEGKVYSKSMLTTSRGDSHCEGSDLSGPFWELSTMLGDRLLLRMERADALLLCRAARLTSYTVAQTTQDNDREHWFSCHASVFGLRTVRKVEPLRASCATGSKPIIRLILVRQA